MMRMTMRFSSFLTFITAAYRKILFTIYIVQVDVKFEFEHLVATMMEFILLYLSVDSDYMDNTGLK